MTSLGPCRYLSLLKSHRQSLFYHVGSRDENMNVFGRLLFCLAHATCHRGMFWKDTILSHESGGEVKLWRFKEGRSLIISGDMSIHN